jgi:predicted unusual protein kinase regulating ubiquinone biosynthesis (AarF/ABC1/UbiB family)
MRATMSLQPTPAPTTTTTVSSKQDSIDRLRYFRLTSFFAGVIAQFIFWDLLIGRIWIIGGVVKSRRPMRFRRIARRFRFLSVRMGGVMIKLGQFLSARVDILPSEIIEELVGLQDEVPPVPLSEIERVLNNELGDPLRVFVSWEQEPLAAASLGQTHRAWLRSMEQPIEGLPVVVKIQRPNIERLVRTDLSALERVSGWVMKYRPIRRRANVPALLEEFGETLWEELDYRLEVQNAERFAKIFDDGDGVYVPEFFTRYCTNRVLTMENVEGLKLTELDGIAAAGIDPKQIADRLLDIYYKQVFEASFFHADPHPGNLFLRTRPDRPHSASDPMPFDIVFIDFGMMGQIPERTTELLRKTLISVTTRNVQALTDAYADLGFFLPEADLDRIVEAQEKILNQIWGRDLMDLANPDINEVAELGAEFRDLLFDFPFQIPQNFIYLGRALGILSGLSALLNPTINPWFYVEKYGRRLVSRQSLRQAGITAILDIVREYAAVPLQAKRVLNDLERGKLKLNVIPDRQMQRQLDRLEKRTRQINSTLVAAALLLSGTALYVGDSAEIGVAFWIAAGSIYLLSVFRSL